VRRGAFSSWDGEGTTSLSVIPSTGGERTRLLARQGRFVGQPSWSPDSTTIAFRILTSDPTDPDAGVYDADIYRIDADDGELTKLGEQHGVADTAPVWTPDGSRIAFWGRDGRGTGMLLSMRPDGSDVREFLAAPGGEEVLVPDWSTNRAWISLSGLEELQSRVYIVRARDEQVFVVAGNGAEATWRPAST
jgi:Tol biopolymer transport system component